MTYVITNYCFWYIISNQYRITYFHDKSLNTKFRSKVCIPNTRDVIINSSEDPKTLMNRLFGAILSLLIDRALADTVWLGGSHRVQWFISLSLFTIHRYQRNVHLEVPRTFFFVPLWYWNFWRKNASLNGSKTGQGLWTIIMII